MPRTKEQIKEYKKNYYQKNKETLKKAREKNLQNEEWVKKEHLRRTIQNWKERGLILDTEADYLTIYYMVMDTKNCEKCGCILTVSRWTTSTTRCMDHDHNTGEFRGVICHACNITEGNRNRKYA